MIDSRPRLVKHCILRLVLLTMQAAAAESVTLLPPRGISPLLIADVELRIRASSSVTLQMWSRKRWTTHRPPTAVIEIQVKGPPFRLLSSFLPQ